jgi:pimeloyl-ACP methyl ester carboxylesterase
VKEFCDYIGIKKMILVGHSLGGRVGIVLAAKSPALVEKLILVDPAGVKTKSVTRILLKTIAMIFRWVPKNLRNKIHQS